MIPRLLSEKALQLHQQFPAIMITGPRQSGKTTLIHSLFSHLPYVTLEDPDTRSRALNDPRGFLQQFPDGAALDEVQRTPELFSYLQHLMDSQPERRYVLSGSQHFLLMEQVSQSLAGRVAILRLLPLSLEELNNGGYLEESSADEYVFQGGFPRIFSQGIAPYDFYSAYLETYVERDVRQLRQVGDLNRFIRFIKLCAGRIGQLLNIASLASDTGVSHTTAQAWLSVLETSHIVFLLQPHFKNFNKRIVKMPKLYFTDTGLACNLLGIEAATQLSTHFLRGGLFENLVILEALKGRYNAGKKSNLYFWRDNHGHEVDLLIENADLLLPVEIKSAATTNMSFFDGLKYWRQLATDATESGFVAYGGHENFKTSSGDFISWRHLKEGFKM